MRKKLNYFLLILIVITLPLLSGSGKGQALSDLPANLEASNTDVTSNQDANDKAPEGDSSDASTPTSDTAESGSPEPGTTGSNTANPNTPKPNAGESNKNKPNTIEELLANMSLEEKVKQLLIAGCSNISSAQSAAKYGVGGLCLYAGVFDNQDAAGVRVRMDGLQNSTQIPMLIGVDEEGGTVCRISSNPKLRATRFLSPSALYKQGGWGLIQRDTQEKAQLLLGLGINLNFAPVCDVPLSASDYIFPRCFSIEEEIEEGNNKIIKTIIDAKLTGQYISLVVKIMKEQGLGSSLKHFPGYGGSNDTHLGMAYDSRPFEAFENSDFLPFAAGIAAGADSVMVSHNIVQCMDPNFPASLSPEVHRILRERLGFTGVIMTDDLSMGAISQFTGGKDAAVQALIAGNDIILCGANYERSTNAIVAAVRDGTIPVSRIDDSVLRVLKFKEHLKLNVVGR